MIETALIGAIVAFPAIAVVNASTVKTRWVFPSLETERQEFIEFVKDGGY